MAGGSSSSGGGESEDFGSGSDAAEHGASSEDLNNNGSGSGSGSGNGDVRDSRERTSATDLNPTVAATISQGGHGGSALNRLSKGSSAIGNKQQRASRRLKQEQQQQQQEDEEYAKSGAHMSSADDVDQMGTEQERAQRQKQNVSTSASTNADNSTSQFETQDEDENEEGWLTFEDLFPRQETTDEDEPFEVLNPLYSHGGAEKAGGVAGNAYFPPTPNSRPQSTGTKLRKMIPRDPEGSLHITVVEGEDMRKVTRLSKQDPYVTVLLQGRRASTTRKSSGGLSPKWDVTDPENTIVLPVFPRASPSEPEPELSVEVWDLKNRFVGASSLQFVRQLGSSPKTVKLRLEAPDNTPAGTLSLKVSYRPVTLQQKVENKGHFLLVDIPKKFSQWSELRARGVMPPLTRFSEALVRSLDGAAGGFVVSLGLSVPFLLAMLLTNWPFAIVQWLLVFPLTCYAILSFPVWFGNLFAAIISATGLHGYEGGFRVGTLTITPWIRDWRLHCRIVAEDCAFGNPPGFPFEDFVHVGHTDIQGSFTFEHLWDWILQRYKPMPLKKVPDFQMLVKFDFHHIEFEDVMLDFQMYEGKFNINHFTRLLAEGEARDHGWMRQWVTKEEPLPNEFKIKIVRAKGLKKMRDVDSASAGNTALEPYVVVRLRRDKRTTHTQTQTCDPMFNEEFFFNAEDASTVVHVAVYNREVGKADEMVGQWVMTLKWFFGNPYYCWHEQGLEVSPDRHMKGWFPLMNKAWRGLGQYGTIEMHMHWYYTESPKETYNPTPLKALAQLEENSAETRLRMGDLNRIKHWLNHEPYLYDIRRVTVRNVEFHVQDLFRGYVGRAESKGVEHAEHVKIERLDYFKEFRPKHPGDEGITTFKVVYNFFRGAIPKIMNKSASGSRIGGALGQITTSGLYQVTDAWGNLVRGDFDKVGAVQSAKRGAKNIGGKIDSAFQGLHRTVTQNKSNDAQFKIAVTADDHDFLIEEPELSGYLERAAKAKPAKQHVTDVWMESLAGKKAPFKKKFFELKNQTIFYRKNQGTSKNTMYNVTYKIDLTRVKGAIYFPKQQELILNQEDDGHVVRLRMPTGDASTVEGEDTSIGGDSNPTLQNWIDALKACNVPCFSWSRE